MTKKEERELDELTYEREKMDKAVAAKRAIYEALPYIGDYSVWELCNKAAVALGKFSSEIKSKKIQRQELCNKAATELMEFMSKRTESNYVLKRKTKKSKKRR